MPRIPRKLLVDPTEVGVFHCLSRCVRRAFLCGADPLSGKNFDHRKLWLQERLAFLAGEFGIDLLGFAVMSNHLHVILRNRPDVVVGWTDDEVARRWWNLFPLRRDDAGNPAEPEEWELSLVIGHADRLAEIRRRQTGATHVCARLDGAQRGVRHFSEGSDVRQAQIDVTGERLGAEYAPSRRKPQSRRTVSGFPVLGPFVQFCTVLFSLYATSTLRWERLDCFRRRFVT